MSEFRNISRAWLLIAGALPLAALPLTASAGGDSIDRKVAAQPNGEVIISNVSGTIDVRGWDRNEVQVTGHLGHSVERVDAALAVDNAGRQMARPRLGGTFRAGRVAFA